MLALLTAVQVFLVTRPGRSHRPPSHSPSPEPARPDPARPDPARHGQRGQATAEYALVLLAAATVALVLVAWATKTGKLGELFDAVIDSVKGKVA